MRNPPKELVASEGVAAGRFNRLACNSPAAERTFGPTTPDLHAIVAWEKRNLQTSRPWPNTPHS